MKAKSVVSMLYCLVNSLAGKDAEITRDPLGKRYEVNKHSLHISTERMPLHTLQEGIETTLKGWGWVLDKSTSMPCWIFEEDQHQARVTITSMGTNSIPYLNLHVMVYRKGE